MQVCSATFCSVIKRRRDGVDGNRRPSPVVIVSRIGVCFPAQLRPFLMNSSLFASTADESCCLSNAMHSIGQSIKSPLCPCVRPCVLHFLSYLSSTFPFPSPFPFSFPSFIPSPFPSLSPFLYPSHFLFSFPSPFPFLFPFCLPPSISLSFTIFSFLFPFPIPFSFPLLSIPFLLLFSLSFSFSLSFPFFFPPLPLSLFILPSFFVCPGPCVKYLRRHISITVQNKRMVTMDHL